MPLCSDFIYEKVRPKSVLVLGLLGAFHAQCVLYNIDLVDDNYSVKNLYNLNIKLTVDWIHFRKYKIFEILRKCHKKKINKK